MSMLPSGLELLDAPDFVPLRICKADPDGPWFTVSIKRISVGQFRALAQRHAAPAGVKPGTRAGQQHEAKFVEAFTRAVIEGWEGLTLENWEAMFPGARIGGESQGEWRKSQKQIPYTPELAAHIYAKAWPDRFGDLVLQTIREGAEAEEGADLDLKND